MAVPDVKAAMATATMLSLTVIPIVSQIGPSWPPEKK